MHKSPPESFDLPLHLDPFMKCSLLRSRYYKQQHVDPVKDGLIEQADQVRKTIFLRHLYI